MRMSEKDVKQNYTGVSQTIRFVVTLYHLALDSGLGQILVRNINKNKSKT